MGATIISITLLAFIIMSLFTVLFSFAIGAIWSHWKYTTYVKEVGCPFKHACLHYDSNETRKAIKRVLTLMLDNKVPVSEIKDLINQSISK